MAQGRSGEETEAVFFFRSLRVWHGLFPRKIKLHLDLRRYFKYAYTAGKRSGIPVWYFGLPGEKDSMKKYEYKVVLMATKTAMTVKNMEAAAKAFEQELNRFGAEGWELIQREDGMFFFKREL